VSCHGPQLFKSNLVIQKKKIDISAQCHICDEKIQSKILLSPSRVHQGQTDSVLQIERHGQPHAFAEHPTTPLLSSKDQAQTYSHKKVQDT
jgi:hypothetical protein